MADPTARDDLASSVPPVVTPPPGVTGSRTIRHGRSWNIGYDVSSTLLESRYVVVPRGLGGARRANRYSLDSLGWARAWADFADREPGSAREHLAELRRREHRGAPVPEDGPAIPLLTLSHVPGREIVEVLGLVTATSVVSRDLFSDLGTDLAGVFGGSLQGVERAIGSATAQARQRLCRAATDLGADTVVGIAVSIDTVGEKGQSVLVVGTAVRTGAG